MRSHLPMQKTRVPSLVGNWVPPGLAQAEAHMPVKDPAANSDLGAAKQINTHFNKEAESRAPQPPGQRRRAGAQQAVLALVTTRRKRIGARCCRGQRPHSGQSVSPGERRAQPGSGAGRLATQGREEPAGASVRPSPLPEGALRSEGACWWPMSMTPCGALTGEARQRAGAVSGRHPRGSRCLLPDR